MKVDELSKAVMDTLAEYRDVTVDKMKQAIDKVSKEAVKELKSDSPKRTGAYAQSWTSKSVKMPTEWGYEKTVFNKKHYRITHLLEKGHKVRPSPKYPNKKSFVDAVPRIEKVEKKAIEDLVKEIKNDA